MLEREGIPMVLALVSEVGEMPAAPDTLAEGESLAERMDRLRLELAPSGRDADMAPGHQRAASGVLRRLRRDSVVGCDRADLHAHRDAIASGHYLRVVNYHNTPNSGRDSLRGN